ncbi:DUF2784 domain-containing protein [Pseudonocardia kujensis]|uniref:DUF2784 domain-containing protein n=1 Tax=Pseudonocardia kujensis TaxID=1128675 RepID=UPI001E468645|nr:DUF2784 domain-containing protein [Pseudonocardia kujensis]MCE0767966.1 DUF2784 domain-containing protein [Pseudonocardia kujensis]
MGYRLLADAVMLVHFAFLAFVALGGFLAWRRPRVLVLHAAAVEWGLVSVFAHVSCPLTAWEDRFRRLAGEHGLARGFIDTYLTGVVYPREYLPAIQLAIGCLVVASWVGLVLRRRRHRMSIRRAPRRRAILSPGRDDRSRERA